MKDSDGKEIHTNWKEFEFIVFIAIFAILASLAMNAHSYTLRNFGTTPVVQDGGDKAIPINVCLSSNTATLIASGTDYYRNTFIQNPLSSSSFDITLGTWSGVNFSTTTPRIVELPPGGAFTTGAHYPIYGRVEPGGGTVCVIGVKEFQDGDNPRLR